MFKSLFAYVFLLLGCSARAQVFPDHPYNGVNRPLLVKINSPKGLGGKLELWVMNVGETVPVKKMPVNPGKQDLAKIVPDLWTPKKPVVLYVQLASDGKEVGPATILQPMLNPPLVHLKADGKTPDFKVDEDGPMFNGYRAYVDKDILFETSLGAMRFRMRPDAAPNTVWNIMELVKGGLYTNTIFHRVVALAKGNPFVIQGGDPTGTGSGGPGFAYPLESTTLPHDFGVISIARSTDPNTNGCQIFVCLSREGTKRLDGRYAAFGQAISGADTILKIAAVPVGKDDRPLNPPVIRRARLVDALPYGTGPAPVARPKD